MTSSATWTRALISLLPSDCVVTDPDVIEGYRRDRAEMAEAGTPGAVVRARSAGDVQAVLRLASSHRIPVVVRGAGTGLSGGSAAIDGCITVSTERMRRLEIDAAAGIARVGPGVLNGELKSAARAEGLWYPPDPSSFEICSIGGNLATNAGGLCCVKYGVTTDYVLSLEVVLADGTLVRLGGSTVKDVAGYDLKRLFVGSEGTLGVMTEATLRLRPLPPPATTVVATFDDVVAAGHAVTAIMSRCRPSALELMDATAVRAVEAMLHMGLQDCGALLLGRSDAVSTFKATSEMIGDMAVDGQVVDGQVVDGQALGGEALGAEAQWMIEACEKSNATYVAYTNDEQEGDLFMAARRMAIPAVEKLGTVLIEDIGVPIPRIPDLVAGIAQVAESQRTMIAVIGHAGDGNFHPLVTFERRDPEAVTRARQAFSDVMDLGLALGGTITGEHGVGTLKRPWLGSQLGEDVMALNRRIKAALDPLGILNPGKVFEADRP